MISNVSSLRYWEWHCQRSQYQFTSQSRGIRLRRVPITMKTKMSSRSGNRKIEWGSCGTAVTVWLSHLLGLPWGSSRDPRLQQQTFIFSQFWRPEVQDQAGGGAGFFWGISLWLVNVTFCLCPHSIFPVCVCPNLLFLLACQLYWIKSHPCTRAETSVLSDSLWLYAQEPTRRLCPWEAPGTNTGSGLPYPAPRDLPDPGIEPKFLMSPALQAGSLPLAPRGKPKNYPYDLIYLKYLLKDPVSNYSDMLRSFRLVLQHMNFRWIPYKP